MDVRVGFLWDVAGPSHSADLSSGGHLLTDLGQSARLQVRRKEAVPIRVADLDALLVEGGSAVRVIAPFTLFRRLAPEAGEPTSGRSTLRRRLNTCRQATK